MFDRILVPLDGSPLAEHALWHALRLGRAFKAPVCLIACVPGTPLDPTDTGEVHVLVRDYLERMCAPLRDAGLEATSLLSGDEAAEFIVDEADRLPGTLVIMSTHGRTGIGRWTLGSVTERVLHASRSAMLVVRPRGDGATDEVKLTSIVVPLDGSPLAEQALAPAIVLALAAGLDLHLLGVLPADVGAYLKDASFAGAWRDVAEEKEASSEAYLQAAAARARTQGVAGTSYEVAFGAPAERIIDVAQASPGCLVAMTTHGRSRIGRWVMGSVAERVVRHCPVPVLLLRASDSNAAA